MFDIVEVKVETGDAITAAMKYVREKIPGCERIGSGLYGVVYSAPNFDRVLKTGRFSDSDGYSTYLKVLSKCKKHNPFTPLIFNVTIFSASSYGDNIYVVEMERLKTLNDDSNKMPYENIDAARKFIAEQCYTSKNKDSSKKIHEVLGVRTTIPFNLRAAIKILIDAREQSVNGWDLHEGNFMMRGDQIVVTDPLS